MYVDFHLSLPSVSLIGPRQTAQTKIRRRKNAASDQGQHYLHERKWFFSLKLKK